MARPQLSVPEGIRRLALALPQATEEVTWGGWLAIQLGRRPDWAEVEELITTSYRLIAPKTLGRLVQR